jgi:hypothetical protein
MPKTIPLCSETPPVLGSLGKVGKLIDVPSGKLTWRDNSKRPSSGLTSGRNFLEGPGPRWDDWSLMETLLEREVLGKTST